MTRVLVTGASIAGPTAAYWLAQAGFDVTVLEKAPELRPGGQNIDVRGTGRGVLELMGLVDAVRARNTGEVGTRFLDEDGKVVSEFPLDEDAETDGPTAELEILRGALSQVIVDACPDDVEWRFGASITAVSETGSGVDVTLSDGSTETYDLLVVAEGVGSHTRDLVLADEEVEERALGMYMTYGTIERTPADDDYWNALIVPGSRQVSLRPDDEGTTRAMLNFLVDEPVLKDLDQDGVRAALRERFGDLGWEVPRILDGFDVADDLYVDHLRQVIAPTWHHGRTVLLGDAAWCVTTIGGSGTALAITGAYVLAAHLSQVGPGEHERAFEEYEQWMRPMVEDQQKLPPGTPRIAAPKSRAGVAVLRTATRVAALPVVQAVASRLGSGSDDAPELPKLEPADEG